MKKGFTIIELLIVLVLVAVGTVIALPKHLMQRRLKKASGNPTDENGSKE